MRRVAPAALTAVFALAGCGTAAHRTTTGFAAPTVLRDARPAPEIALRDQDGHAVRLSDFRGRAVLLTFIYVHCPDVCPLIVGNLHAALERLGTRASRAHVIAVSVDPRGDTPAAVRAFVRAHGMIGRMTYLLGTRAQLAPVWRAYGVAVTGSPEHREVSHGAFVFGIDARGRRRVFFGQGVTPAVLAHDIPLLAAA